ncbi:MAG: trypsin-like peptidase domain-containing protein [Armatimonadota bacterium]|nr:trypsin-like peptidase domain-containing protein [Armatimonadota bacterium]
MKSTGRIAAFLLVALLGVFVGVGLAWLGLRLVAPAASSQPAALPRGTPQSRAAAPGASPEAPPPRVSRKSQDAVTAAIARVGPAVVNINTLYRPVIRDPMERALREIIGSPSDPFPRKGQGSGIIIDGEQGYVLTNAHVVKGASRVDVNLADGRRLEATIVGVDPFSEVAVLRVPGGDLPAATLGSAADLPIGSWVIAIGNPFGFENSVTVGVISAKDRTLTGPNRVTLHDLLQTDASINPGNSGGALVDLNGDVVGIPTAIIPYAQGMGFAVSVDVAKQVAERLIATGKTPWLGITHRGVTPGLAQEIGLPEPKGSLVVEVVRGGPAARAGMLPGDVIVRIGDQEIDTARSLGFAVRSHDVGARVPVTIWRKGRERTLEVTLGAVPM